jgi:hypothetical protein
MIIFCIYFPKYDIIVYMKRENSKFIVFLLVTLLPLSLCFGQDERSAPAAIYVMFDNSVSMKGSGEEAAAWLNDHIMDDILQIDDSLTVWSLADETSLQYSGDIETRETLEEIKAVLSSITVTDGEGNYQAAFEDLKDAAASLPRGVPSYIVLVTGLSGQSASFFSADAAEVLKHSLSRDFPGWKVMVIGLGMEQKIKAAAAAYMDSQG